MRISKLAVGAWMLVVLCGYVAAGNSVPLEDWRGKPIVDLTIQGEGPFRFILDSGADVTVIDHGLAGRFEFKQLGQTEIGSPLGGTVPATRLQLSDVHLGSIDLGTVEALDIDLAGVLGSGDAPVGVLATADLGRRSLAFDFSGKRLSVSDTLLPPANGSDVFDFCSPTGKPSMTVQVGGEQHCVNLDTGSPTVLSLPLSVAAGLPLSSKPSVRGKARLVGAEVDVWGARLDGELRVGQLVVADPRLSFMETDALGNIGQGLLRDADLTIDHANSRVRVRNKSTAARNAGATTGPQIRRVAQPAGKKRYGIRLRGSLDAELRVAGVEPDSPAEASGLQAGDLIMTLNGVSVDELDSAARVSALRGSPLKLHVQRDGQLQELTLRLE